MKERFREYHIIDDLDNIYEEALIVLDTNSLLNLYRYSEDTRGKYFEILKKVQSRLYLTHHVCGEFYRNRVTIIENRSTFKETIDELVDTHLEKLLNIIKNSSGSDRYNSALSILKHENDLKKEIIGEIEKSSKKIKKSISGFEQDLNLKYVQDRDPILAEVVKIFQKRISNELELEDIERILKEGELRYSNKVPPGYGDDDKDSPEKYGDLIIWNELQCLAKDKKKDILFVSDDRKEDWAIKFKGYDLGPRKELIKEFLDNTNQLFYSITTNGFIKLISESYEVSDTETLEEETKIIHKSIEQQERRLSVERRENFEKQQEFFERMRKPLKSSDEERTFFERLRNPMTDYEKQQEALERMRNPSKDLEEYRRSMELIRNPSDDLREYREMLENAKKPNNDIEALRKILADARKKSDATDKKKK